MTKTLPVAVALVFVAFVNWAFQTSSLFFGVFFNIYIIINFHLSPMEFSNLNKTRYLPHPSSLKYK